MRIHLIGTGAVGSLYGGLLSRAGASVTAQCRSDFDQVSREGIRIESRVGLGEWIFKPSQVIQPGEPLRTQPEIVLLAVKLTPRCDRIALLKPVVGRGTVIVSISNGLEVENELAESFPQNEVIGGVAFVCATRTQPGHVIHQAYGHIVLGRYPKGHSVIGETLVSRWLSTGASAEYSTQLEAVRWQKTLWNASFSALCTISNAHTAAVLGGAEELVRKVMEEIHQTATQLGHVLPNGIIEKQINGTHRMPPYLPSMTLDRAAGEATEVEVILGNALRAARRIGFRTPYLDTLYTLMKLQS
ncbi:MAG: hypothetical protein RLZ25_816 [Pseudomonadota bacterium]|jgi:2-dehydropantoate 2-reductase